MSTGQNYQAELDNINESVHAMSADIVHAIDKTLLHSRTNPLFWQMKT